MFPWIDRVAKPSHRFTQTDRLVHEVVDRSIARVRKRLSRSADAMGPAELRGYIRARAVRPVRCEAQQICTRYLLPDSSLNDVVHRALERTVHLLVCEAAAPPVVRMPAAHVRQRAAA